MELNAQLQPVNAIPAMNSGYVSSYDFDSYIERSAISGVKLRNFSFNAGTGGTIQLGGVNNQNGLLTVLDASGSTIVTINNAGVTVENGNVTIKNGAGTTILDSTGLVSNANFVTASTVSLNNTRTTNSSTFVDVNNTNLSLSLTRSTKVLFLAYGDFANIVGANEICSEYTALNIGGTLFPDSGNGFGNVFFFSDNGGAADSSAFATWHGHYLATLGSGVHTAKLQFRKQGAYGTFEVDARVINTGLTYVILGS